MSTTTNHTTRGYDEDALVRERVWSAWEAQHECDSEDPEAHKAFLGHDFPHAESFDQLYEARQATAREAIRAERLNFWKKVADGKERTASLEEMIRAGHVPSMLKEDMPDTPMLIEGMVPIGTANLEAGNPKIGKTWAALQKAICTATGTPFMGREVRKAKVLMAEEEGTWVSTQKRVQKMATWMGLPIQTDGLHPLDNMWVLPRPKLRLSNLDAVAEFAATIERLGIEVIYLGPLTRVARFENENDSGEVSRFWEALQNIAHELNITILISHHNRKYGAVLPRNVEEAVQNVRGSIANSQEPDTIYGLVRDPARDHGHMFVRGREARDKLTGRYGDQWIPYRLKPGTMMMELADTDHEERPVKQQDILNWLFTNHGRPYTTTAILEGLLTPGSDTRIRWMGAKDSKKKTIARELDKLQDETLHDSNHKVVAQGPKEGNALTYTLSNEYYEALCEAKGIDPDEPDRAMERVREQLTIMAGGAE